MLGIAGRRSGKLTGYREVGDGPRCLCIASGDGGWCSESSGEEGGCCH